MTPEQNAALQALLRDVHSQAHSIATLLAGLPKDIDLKTLGLYTHLSLMNSNLRSVQAAAMQVLSALEKAQHFGETPS